jgi:hypothetical protein
LGSVVTSTQPDVPQHRPTASPAPKHGAPAAAGEHVGTAQRPERHSVPLPHPLLHWPQCVSLVFVSVQVPLQQTPLTLPTRHARPEVVAVHAVSTQADPMQLSSLLQALPQAPQFFGSDLISTHAPPQQSFDSPEARSQYAPWCPSLQMPDAPLQTPFWQVWPAGHWTPHPPQFFGSLSMSSQVDDKNASQQTPRPPDGAAHRLDSAKLQVPTHVPSTHCCPGPQVPRHGRGAGKHDPPAHRPLAHDVPHLPHASLSWAVSTQAPSQHVPASPRVVRPNAHFPPLAPAAHVGLRQRPAEEHSLPAGHSLVERQ